MATLEFSAPFNNDLQTLDELLALKQVGENRIREIYLAGPQEYSGACRIIEEVSLAQFLEIVDRIHAAGVRTNLVLNSTCEGSNWYSRKVVDTTMEYLRLVHEEHGVEAVTIANPLYIAEARKRFPNLEISASVVSEIDCVQRAVIFRQAGADVITPDVNINRDLKLLKEIKKTTGAEIKLMVNEGCLYKCPFRKFHFNYMSHKSRDLGEVEGDHFFANCSRVTLGDPSQILRSCWIRPEDLERYSQITSFFKIVGRARTKSYVIRATRAYLEQSWEGSLLDILSSSINKLALEYGAYVDNKSLDRCRFFEKTTSHSTQYKDPSFYQDLAQQVVRFRVLTRGVLEDLGLRQIADELDAAGRLPLDAATMPGAPVGAPMGMPAECIRRGLGIQG